MKKANFLSLDWQDAGKGIILAFLTVFVAALYTSFSGDHAHLPTLAELKVDAIAGAGAALAYIIKNFLTNSQDQFAKSEPKMSVVDKSTTGDEQL